MAAVMDLDLNCAPPEPEPAPAHAMLRQEHAFRHQVEDLHRLYWAQRNLPHGVPFWEQSHDVLYPTHSIAMPNSSQSQSQSQSHMVDPHVSGASSHGAGSKQAVRCGNGVAGNLGSAEGSSARRKPEHGGGVRGRSGCRRMIDLEKPVTSEDDGDDVEILSPSQFSGYVNRNAGFVDNSQCYLRDNAAHVRFSEFKSIPHCPA